MKRITLPIAAIFALAPLLALVGATPSYAAPHASRSHAGVQVAVTYTPLCEKESPYLCWRDPSDGGLATEVANSEYGTDKARSWYVHTDYDRCGGNVSNSGACPFTPGSGLNFDFNGDRIVYVQNVNGYCAGSSLSDQGHVEMHSCDSVGGVSELATVFVEQKFSNHFRLVSVVQSDNCVCHSVINGTPYTGGGLQYLYVDGTGGWDGWVGAGTGF